MFIRKMSSSLTWPFCSAEGKGMYRIGITSFAFFPLSAANPTQAPNIIESVGKQIAEMKKGRKLPPGLAEQYDIQLEMLRSDTLPDLEIVAIPGHMSLVGKFFSSTLFFTPDLLLTSVPPESGKRYVTMLFILQHPFSRGHIVCRYSLSSSSPCLINELQHATSKDHISQPEIDANYFDWDIGE